MKRNDPTIDRLRGVPLFSACTGEELELMSSRMTRVTFRAGEVLATEGAVGRELLVIVEGTATVAVGAREVARLGPGDFFGEVALLDDGPRTATVTADTDGVAEVASHAEFKSLLLDAPHLVRNLLTGLARRLRAANLQLSS